ncbi:MAG: N-acetylmuramoyl-L-alanine amidase-like domain-containing protein [Gemmatimonadales bacterium]
MLTLTIRRQMPGREVPDIGRFSPDAWSWHRRDVLRAAAALLAGLFAPVGAIAGPQPKPDEARLDHWISALRAAGLDRHAVPLGRAVARTGELAAGTVYQAGTLDAYLRAGMPPAVEPLTVSLTRFDCVTLVESCLGVARTAAQSGPPTWDRFGRAIERMRYRGGRRMGYASRLHYFSEWISDGAGRGLVRDLGGELGGAEDTRPLRFMTEHRASYPALRDDGVFGAIAAMERRLDGRPRRVVPTKRIPEVVDRIETGDVLAFATGIPGLDVTHSALAHRGPDGILRVLHAPLSGGVVEVTRTTLPEYVAAIRRATGILVARPLRA